MLPSQKKSVPLGEKGTLIKNSVIASVSRLPLTLPRLFVPPLENPQMSGQARVGKGTGATEEKQKRKSFGISPKDYNIPGQRPLDRNMMPHSVPVRIRRQAAIGVKAGELYHWVAAVPDSVY